MPVVLALDVGTTSIAASAVSHDGRLVGVVRRSNDAAIPNLPAGYAEQDPRRLREIACDALRELAAGLQEAPAALGITGQMHGTLLVDAGRRPLTNLITWQDLRALRPVHDSGRGGGPTCLDMLHSRCSPAAVHSTGCRLSRGFLGTTLFVLAEQRDAGVAPPIAWNHLSKAAFVADWIAAELTGGEIVTDPSNAASSGVYDLEHRVWSPDLLAAAQIDPAWLPEVRESGEVIGRVSEAAAKATGLPAGLPVCNAIGDNQAAVLGSVPAGDPAIQINVGTGGQVNWPVSQFVRVEGMETRYLPVRRLMLVGPGLSGGDAYAWVNRTVQSWLGAFGVSLDREAIYSRLNELAAAVPDDAAGLACEPFFRGTRRDPTIRGRFSGVGVDNFTPGHVARAVLRGIAAAMWSFYEHAGRWKPADLPRIVGSGNGLRKNPLLVQAIEQAFGRPVLFPVHEEEAAFGTALLAGVSAGLWPDLATAGRLIRLQSPLAV